MGPRGMRTGVLPAHSVTDRERGATRLPGAQPAAPFWRRCFELHSRIRLGYPVSSTS